MTFLSTAIDGCDPSVYLFINFVFGFFFALRNVPPYACMPIVLVFVLFCLSVVFGLTTLVEKRGNHYSGAFYDDAFPLTPS